MERIEHFVPADSAHAAQFVSRLRSPVPPGVAGSYVEAGTDPGETVVVPYCQGDSVVRDILASGRRILALSYDPVLALVVKNTLAPVPRRELDAAVAQLGDSLKQGVPLRHYMSGLYATTCPACFRSTDADYFVWDREQGFPVAKQLCCSSCNYEGRTAFDAEDQERLDQVPVRGMHYHYILDRVAPPEGMETFRTRLETLMGLYSPRNLYALAELTLRIESQFPDEPLHSALTVLLLDCLDRCSSLTPLPGSRARRSGLSRPNRFAEWNVWQAFEEAIERTKGVRSGAMHGISDAVAGTLDSFVATPGDRAAYVGQGLVRDLARTLPPRSCDLILFSPPLLSSAAWSLSYFWGAWLMGAGAVDPLRPLLRQRTPDPSWYAQVMTASLRALAGLLRDEGRMNLILRDQPAAVVEALVLASRQARMGLVTLQQSGADYRLELSPTMPQSTRRRPSPHGGSLPSLRAEIREVTVQATADVLRARGEPSTWRTVHAAVQRQLAATDLIAKAMDAGEEGPNPLDLIAEQVQAGLEDPRFVRMPGVERGEDSWWLAYSDGAAQPLCDRVEDIAHSVLENTLALTEHDFASSVFSHFPGALAPCATLVSECLRAYGDSPTMGYWQLRSEDQTDARETELREIVSEILSLGWKLGFRTREIEPFQAAWLEESNPRAVFVVNWRASLSTALELSDQAAGANPYLVFPGGRSALLSYKLRHNPLWQQEVEAAGWRFIKYRHVRQLASQIDVDEYALRTIVGLDPIVERETAQLSLF